VQCELGFRDADIVDSFSGSQHEHPKANASIIVGPSILGIVCVSEGTAREWRYISIAGRRKRSLRQHTSAWVAQAYITPSFARHMYCTVEELRVLMRPIHPQFSGFIYTSKCKPSLAHCIDV